MRQKEGLNIAMIVKLLQTDRLAPFGLELKTLSNIVCSTVQSTAHKEIIYALNLWKYLITNNFLLGPTSLDRTAKTQIKDLRLRLPFNTSWKKQRFIKFFFGITKDNNHSCNSNKYHNAPNKQTHTHQKEKEKEKKKKKKKKSKRIEEQQNNTKQHNTTQFNTVQHSSTPKKKTKKRKKKKRKTTKQHKTTQNNTKHATTTAKKKKKRRKKQSPYLTSSAWCPAWPWSFVGIWHTPCLGLSQLVYFTACRWKLCLETARYWPNLTFLPHEHLTSVKFLLTLLWVFAHSSAHQPPLLRVDLTILDAHFFFWTFSGREAFPGFLLPLLMIFLFVFSNIFCFWLCCWKNASWRKNTIKTPIQAINHIDFRHFFVRHYVTNHTVNATF